MLIESPQVPAQVHDMETGAQIASLTRDGKPAVTYDPGLGYRYPFKVDDAWSSTHQVTNHASGKTTPITVIYKVEAYDSITVPAGKFNAYLVVATDSLGETQRCGLRQRDGVRVVKRIVERAASHPKAPVGSKVKWWCVRSESSGRCGRGAGLVGDAGNLRPSRAALTHFRSYAIHQTHPMAPVISLLLGSFAGCRRQSGANTGAAQGSARKGRPAAAPAKTDKIMSIDELRVCMNCSRPMKRTAREIQAAQDAFKRSGGREDRAGAKSAKPTKPCAPHDCADRRT